MLSALLPPLLPLLATACILLAARAPCHATGYHYDPPTRDRITAHHFPALATVAPLPAVPRLPPLPTGRQSAARGSQLHRQSLVQVHPPSSTHAIAATYQPAAPAYQPRNSYLPSAVGGAPVKTFFSSYVPQGGAPLPSPPPPQQPQHEFGQSYQPRAPLAKQVFLQNPAGADVYVVNGRSLRQYAVVEFIDNDIAPMPEPFLKQSFSNRQRAFVGASGTGAALPPIGQQIDPRSSSLLLEQQRFVQQQQQPPIGSDAFALGSGGLGYIRLPNGSVSLGSGSLGYISGQQRSQSISEARTRHGASMPDALHFGHGALGGTSFFFGMK